MTEKQIPGSYLRNLPLGNFLKRFQRSCWRYFQKENQKNKAISLSKQSSCRFYFQRIPKQFVRFFLKKWEGNLQGNCQESCKGIIEEGPRVINKEVSKTIF